MILMPITVLITALALFILFIVKSVISDKEFFGEINKESSGDESIGEITREYSCSELSRRNKYRHLREESVRICCTKQESTPFKTFTSRTEKNGVLVEVVSEYYPNDTLVYSYNDIYDLFVDEKVEYFYTICMNIKVNGKHHSVHRNINKSDLMVEESDLFNIIWNEIPFDVENKELCENVMSYKRCANRVEQIIETQLRIENYNNIVKSIESE